jgi:multidrug efflux system outer membrane protein
MNLQKIFGCKQQLSRLPVLTYFSKLRAGSRNLLLSRKTLSESSPRYGHIFALSTALLTLSACDLSPEYQLPDLKMPEIFKEMAAPQGEEKTAEEAAALDHFSAEGIDWKRVDEKAKIEEFAWWRMFKNPALDGLMEQAMKDNPSLDIAVARVEAARALAGISASNLYPSIGVGAGPERQLPSSARASANSGSGAVTTKPYTTYTAQGHITYELDLFGKQRNSTRAAERNADAEANAYRAARLALQADIAQTYFALAALNTESDALLRTRDAGREALALVRKKQAVGEIDDLALSSAEAQLANVEAEYSAVAQQRAVAEHQLAALMGSTPQQFTLPKVTLGDAPPVIPAGIPSRLLERRPDIQAAVEQIAAANARIGAARAGYFPDISLSASGGFAAKSLGDLFNSTSKFWALGPMAGSTVITQPLFEGGLIGATLDERKANYDGAVARYRESAITALREVEDQLSATRNLSEQAVARKSALKAAKRAFAVAGKRYKVGYSSQLEYLDATRQYLAAERSHAQVTGQRHIATVQLIRALGGSWEVPAEVK